MENTMGQRRSVHSQEEKKKERERNGRNGLTKVLLLLLVLSKKQPPTLPAPLGRPTRPFSTSSTPFVLCSYRRFFVVELPYQQRVSS